jgi:polysaccharide biosynthesis/export protein VpsN
VNIRLKVGIVYIALLSWCAAVAAADVEPEYRLAAGDEIEIKVYGEDDLSMKIRLNSTGVFNYPYLGNIVAANKTIGQLKDLIHKGLLGDILRKPRINVSVVQYRNFYVAGEVRKPGGFPFEPGLTVRQALALAGGLTEWGSANKIEILRENTSTMQSANLDTQVRAGDTLTVKEGIF